MELHSRIIKDEKQWTYYISGIGTYGESDIRRWWDSAVAAYGHLFNTSELDLTDSILQFL